jgi:uncharacterized protein (TIGR02444 family)
MPTDLWSYALALYARPGVEAACLQLQAEGADVCLLLCAAWLEGRGVSCSAERLEQLQALARPWQIRVVTPLRQLRQSWREAAATDVELADLREQVKGLELAAERQLLERLERCAQPWLEAEGSGPRDWLEPLKTGLTDEGRAALRVLRDAANHVR